MTIKDIQTWLVANRKTFTEKDVEQLCLHMINTTKNHFVEKGTIGVKSMLSHKFNPDYFNQVVQPERLSEEDINHKCPKCNCISMFCENCD